LADIKADQKLAKIEMLRLNRLSVSRITKTEFEYIKSLGN
jgi:predicted RNA-binding protein with PUA-like domain